MGRNKYRGSDSYPFRAGFNPKPKKVFRYKTEKILGPLYLTGKLDGQPVRLLMNRGGTVTVYLAGQAVKELRSAAQLKELLL